MDNSKKIIIEQNRHQFIYCYKGEYRREFIQNLENSYAIQMDECTPMAVNIKDYGLPKLEGSSKLNKSQLGIISVEYLALKAASLIIKKAQQDIGTIELDKKIQRLLNVLSKYSLNKGFESIQNSDNLIEVLTSSKEAYLEIYKNSHIREMNVSLDKIAIPFLQVTNFIELFKKSLNNDSYFAFLIDNFQEVHLSSIQAINLLVSGRINNDISVKVFTEPDNWSTYSNGNGEIIEYVHDFGQEELDESYSKYMLKIKNKYQ